MQEKTLVFTPLKFTENVNLACKNKAVLDGLGTIELKIEPGTLSNTPVTHPWCQQGPVDQSPIYRGMKDDFDMTERTK